MAFKKIRDLDSFDSNTPFNTGDFLAVSDAGGNSTRKVTVKEVIETYNVQRAEEQESDITSDGPELIQDDAGNLVSADPITAANIDDFIDPTSGLEVVSECSSSTDANGDPITVCSKKLKLATSTSATTMRFYVWPQRAVLTKYSTPRKLNDVVTSSMTNTEDLLKGITNNAFLGTLPANFTFFEPGVSSRASDTTWGNNASNVRANARYSLTGQVTNAPSAAALRTEFGHSNDWQYGTTFSEFLDDPTMFTDGFAYSGGNVVPTSIPAGQVRDWTELKYGINTGSMNHWLYSVEFASNPYNNLLTEEDIADGNINYLDDIDARAGAVDYYFSSIGEIQSWLLSRYGTATPAQTTIRIILKEDCIERACAGLFIGHWFDKSASITIHGQHNQDNTNQGYSTSNVSLSLNGDAPKNNNVANRNHTRRHVIICPQRFGFNPYSPNGTLMRTGGYRLYGEYMNFTGEQTVNLNRLRFLVERPSQNFDFLSHTSIENSSYLVRLSGSTAWIHSTDFIINSGSMFTFIEAEQGSSVNFLQGGVASSTNPLDGPDNNLYTKVNAGGGVNPDTFIESQEPNAGTASFVADNVIPGFSAQFIFRNKAYMTQLAFINNGSMKCQNYDINMGKDAIAGNNPKGLVASPPTYRTLYEALSARWHLASDDTGGAVQTFVRLENSSAVEFNIPITSDREGFVFWGTKEMETLGVTDYSAVSSNGQLYADLLRFQQFNDGVIRGADFSAFQHGQNSVINSNPPGLVTIPHSNAVSSWLDSRKFVPTSTIDHTTGSDFLYSLNFPAGINQGGEKQVYSGPLTSIGNQYPIMAHGPIEDRHVGEIVEIWDNASVMSGMTGPNGTPSTPVRRRFKVIQDVTIADNLNWPRDSFGPGNHYEQVTGDYTLPAKFIQSEGYLFNAVTGEFRKVLPYTDLVIGIDEYLLFLVENKKDFVADTQNQMAEVTSFGQLTSTATGQPDGHVFVSSTLNEAMPLRIHPVVYDSDPISAASPARSMYSTRPYWNGAAGTAP